MGGWNVGEDEGMGGGGGGGAIVEVISTCGISRQTAEHLLQSCPIYELLRKGIWPDHTPVARKLYGSLGNLRCIATFIEETGISIWRTRRRRRRRRRH